MEKKEMAIWMICLVISLAVCAEAHETKEKLPYPGFQPDSKQADAFISSIGECSMKVLPTIVRTVTNKDISYNTASRQTIIKHLIKNDIADPNACSMNLDLSKAWGIGQWGLFKSGMKIMSKQIKRSNMESDYYMAVELLMVPGRKNDIGMFGIHIYILDKAGKNAFSFLLNSHHKMFVDAKLYAKDTSKKAKEKLIADSTQVALQALDKQIQLAK